MSPRKALLGLAGVIGLTGSAAAGPPVSPLVEGREPDPVAREFYRDSTPVGGYVARPEFPAPPASGAWLGLTAAVWDVLLDQLTVPLGTAAVTGRADAGGA
jgi:hypothetical protein